MNSEKIVENEQLQWCIWNISTAKGEGRMRYDNKIMKNLHHWIWDQDIIEKQL